MYVILWWNQAPIHWNGCNWGWTRSCLTTKRSNISCPKDKTPDNSILRPTAFTSKSLTEAEKRYINTEREALGILYGLKNSTITASWERWVWLQITVLQVSFFNSGGKCSHLWFCFKILLFIILLFCIDLRHWWYVPIDDNFILWSYCILFYYETSWGTDVMVLGSCIWNLMKHRCYCTEVIYFFSSAIENLWNLCSNI